MKHLVWPLLISLIVFRYFTSRPVYKDGDRVRITAVIFSDPVRYPTGQYFKIGGLKIYLPLFPEIFYGDKISVEGVVEGDKLDDPKLIKVYESKSFLSDFRNSIINFYESTLPQPESGLLAGVVLGSKGSLTADFYNRTKLTGVAHVVVASGTNVTFVISFLMGTLTIFLKRRKAIFFVIVGIILYLFMSGFDAPLVRAALMSGALFLGQTTGRLVSSWRIFFFTAAVMLLYRPDWAADIGFALSFASTASIMLFSKRIGKLLSRVPEIIKEDLSTTLSAQIGVAPILFVTFGQFNILSPLINLMVLWTIPGIMILGAVGGVVGLMLPFLGKFLLYLCYPLLWWFVSIVTLFSF